MLQANARLAAAVAPRTSPQHPEMPSSCGNTCRFFERCEAGALRGGPITTFARRQPIYQEGDPAHHSYKVLEGAVRICRILSDGHRQIIDIALPGDTFGLEGGDTHRQSAEAVGDVTLLRCARTCIDNRVQTDNRGMLVMLSRNLAMAQEHVMMLGHQGAKQRVGSFIVKLARVQKRRQNELIDLPVGRQDMADYLGLTIETTCRTITDLRNAQLISVPNRHQVAIRNMAGLEKIADGGA